MRNPRLHDREFLERRYIEERAILTEIAAEVGSSVGAVYTALLRLGIPVRSPQESARIRGNKPGPKVSVDDEQIRSLLVEKRVPAKDVAEMLGVHYNTVYSAAKRMGLNRAMPRRQRSDASVGRDSQGRIRTASGSGYVRVYVPDHPDATPQGWVYEHRLVMEQKIGRRLYSGEVVHHIDGNRQNNDPDNLLLFPSHSTHKRHHLGRD